MKLKRKAIKFFHILALAGLGVAVVQLARMHLQLGLFSYCVSYEYNKVIAWVEVFLSLYFLGYYFWLLRNHFRHRPPWAPYESEE